MATRTLIADRRGFVAGGALALASGLLARVAWAWVPPADFLVGRMAERRKNVKTLRVKGIRTFSGRSFDGGKQDIAEMIEVNVVDGGYRLERKTPKGIFLEVSDGKRRVSLSEGKPPGAPEPDPRPLERLLFTGATKDEMLAAAQTFGIKTDVSALSRLDGVIVWVIGAKEGDTTSPALWIEKERNLPLKLVDPRAKRTIVFEGWGEPSGAGVVPSRVTILKGDDVQETLKVEETKLNPKLSADLFKPDAPVIATPTPPPTPTPTSEGTPSPEGTPTPAATASPKPSGTPKPGLPRPKPTPKPKPKPR